MRRLRRFLRQRRERAAQREGKLSLSIRGDELVIDPSEGDLILALDRMDADSGSAFMILSRSDYTYLQCSGDNRIGYDLEYQVNSIDEHFRADRESIPSDEIVRRFLAYSRDDPAWKDGLSWQRIEW